MVTQLFSSLLLTATVDRSQKIMMILMPLGIGVFFLFGNFPAGVLIYWVTTNLWTIGQQLVVKQIIQVRENREEVALAASGATITAELPKAKKAGGKGGSKSKRNSIEMKAEGEGKNIEEAEIDALEKLEEITGALLPDQVEYTVISGGSKGFLGMGSAAARAEARLKGSGEEEAETRAAGTSEDSYPEDESAASAARQLP